MINLGIVTTTRADYGILKTLIGMAESSPDYNLNLIVTGTHLSEDFGFTVKGIENDNVNIKAKIEIPTKIENRQDMAESISDTIVKFSQYFSSSSIDVVIVIGDRYETFAVAQAAFYMGKLICHLHGGEVTEGAIDDNFRHCITKLSHMHFTATERYKKRVIQLGEHPDFVFNVGAPGLDLINGMEFLSVSELASSLKIDKLGDFVLCTYNPTTFKKDAGLSELTALFSVLNNYQNKIETKVIFTLPNADPGNLHIRNAIEKFCEDNPSRFFCFESLGGKRYLSALRHCRFVIGNSSSGIIEAPFLGTPCINIGDRQRGREFAETVFNVQGLEKDIENAIDSVFCLNKSESDKTYGDGFASKRILEKLKERFPMMKNSKRFYDV